MPVIKVPHGPKDKYVVMDQRPLNDEKLSWKAKGLLAYLLSKPADWQVWVSDLVKRSSDGEHAVRSAISELTAAGYIRKEQEHREDGTFGPVEYVVYERPESPLGENQEAAPLGGFPLADKPHADNHAYTSNDYTSPEPSDEGSGPAFACPECGQVCRSKGGLTLHRKKMHSVDSRHPALAAYIDNASYQPVASVRQLIIDAVGDDPADVAFWAEVVRAYVALGWNPRNAKNMLEYYEQRKLPTMNGGTNGNRRTPPHQRGRAGVLRAGQGGRSEGERWSSPDHGDWAELLEDDPGDRLSGRPP